MQTKAIEQTTETVRYISSEGRSYDLSVVITRIDDDSPMPLVLKEDRDGTITASYADGSEESFGTISQAVGWHGGYVSSFRSVQNS